MFCTSCIKAVFLGRHAVKAAAYCWISCVACVCRCLGHNTELCKNGWTSRDALGGGSRNHALDGVKSGQIHSQPWGVTSRYVKLLGTHLSSTRNLSLACLLLNLLYSNSNYATGSLTCSLLTLLYSDSNYATGSIKIRILPTGVWHWLNEITVVMFDIFRMLMTAMLFVLDWLFVFEQPFACLMSELTNWTLVHYR